MQPVLDIQINQYTPSGLWAANLSFMIHQEFSKGRIQLKNILDCMPRVGFWTMEGDVSTGYFTLATNTENYLEIEDYNPQTQELTGRYQCTFVPTGTHNHYSFLNHLDTLRFTNGRFQVKLKPYR